MDIFRRHIFSSIGLFIYLSWWTFSCYHLVSTEDSDIKCRNDLVGILFISAVSLIIYTLILLFLIIKAKKDRLDYFKFLVIIYIISTTSIAYLRLINYL